MEDYELGAIVAERALYDSGGEVIRITIGAPQFISEKYGFFCPYKIWGFGDDKLRRAAGGLDAVHAIQLVLQKIATEIHILNEANGNALRWEGGEDGDTGFPMSEDVRAIMEKKE